MCDKIYFIHAYFLVLLHKFKYSFNPLKTALFNGPVRTEQ